MSALTPSVSEGRNLIQGDLTAVNGDYEKGVEVAKGEYSRVVEATNKETGKLLMVKIYSTNHEPPDRRRQLAIRNELQILELIKGGVNVVVMGTPRYTNNPKRAPELPMKYYCASLYELLQANFDSRGFKDGYFWVPSYYFAVLFHILAALAFLHSSGVSIMHRKIEPRNILYDKSGQFVLTDFGDARRVHPPCRDPVLARDLFPYRPPEMFDGRPQTPKVDVWMLGIVCMAILDLPWAEEPPCTLEGMRDSLWQQRMAQLAAAYAGRPEIAMMVRMSPDERPSSFGLFNRLSDDPPEMAGTAFRFRPTRELVELKIQGTLGMIPDMELAEHVNALEERYGKFERAKATPELGDIFPHSTVLVPVRSPRLGVSQVTTLPGVQVAACRPPRKLGITNLPTSAMIRQVQRQWQEMTVAERRALYAETPSDPLLVSVVKSEDCPSAARVARPESKAVLPSALFQVKRMQAARITSAVILRSKSRSCASENNNGARSSASTTSESRTSERVDIREVSESFTSIDRNASPGAARSASLTSSASSSNPSIKVASRAPTPIARDFHMGDASLTTASAELASNPFSLLANVEAIDESTALSIKSGKGVQEKYSSPRISDQPRSGISERMQESNSDQARTNDPLGQRLSHQSSVARLSPSPPVQILKTKLRTNPESSPAPAQEIAVARVETPSDNSVSSCVENENGNRSAPDQKSYNLQLTSNTQDDRSRASLHALEDKICVAQARAATLTREVENARASVNRLSAEFGQVLCSIKSMSGPINTCVAASTQSGAECIASLRVSEYRQTEAYRSLTFHSMQCAGTLQALECCKKLALESSQSRETGKAKALDILKSLKTTDGIVRSQTDLIQKAERLVRDLDEAKILQNVKDGEYRSIRSHIIRLQFEKRDTERSMRHQTVKRGAPESSALSANAPAWDPVANKWDTSTTQSASAKEVRQASNQPQRHDTGHGCSGKVRTSPKDSDGKSEASQGWQQVVRRQSSKSQRSGSQSRRNDSSHGSQTSSPLAAAAAASSSVASRELLGGGKRSAPTIPSRNHPGRVGAGGRQDGPPVDTSHTRREKRGRATRNRRGSTGTK